MIAYPSTPQISCDELLVSCPSGSCNKSSWPDGSLRTLSETFYAGQNFVGGFCPDEGSGIFVVNFDVLAESRLQLFPTSEDAAANALAGHFGEPAFHQVDPGAVSWGEMEVKARPFGKPLPDDRCLMRSLVVQHDMDIEFSGHVGLDGVEKPAEFLRTMPAMQFTDDAAGLPLQCGEK